MCVDARLQLCLTHLVFCAFVVIVPSTEEMIRLAVDLRSDRRHRSVRLTCGLKSSIAGGRAQTRNLLLVCLLRQAKSSGRRL